MAMIDFGAQASGDKSDEAIKPIHIELLEIFYDPPELKGYFKKLKNFQIIFRVSGDGDSFEGEGPEYLQMAGKGKVIAIDFTIPENRWLDVPNSVFREYILKGVEACFEQLKTKAIEISEVTDVNKLEVDFKSGMEMLRKIV